jgi:hypothetical protein
MHQSRNSKTFSISSLFIIDPIDIAYNTKIYHAFGTCTFKYRPKIEKNAFSTDFKGTTARKIQLSRVKMQSDSSYYCQYVRQYLHFAQRGQSWPSWAANLEKGAALCAPQVVVLTTTISAKIFWYFLWQKKSFTCVGRKTQPTLLKYCNLFLLSLSRQKNRRGTGT